ncbi:MAG: helix-turn-helix domain-containing protein [Solirubrobacterales bacterium]
MGRKRNLEKAQFHLGRAIRFFRLRAKLKQPELAARAELSGPWLSHIESGDVDPTWGNLRRIAYGLEVPLATLLEKAGQYEQEEAEAIGGALRTLRRERRLTQAELAERSGLQTKRLSAIERGYEPPTPEVEARLRKGLGRMKKVTMQAALEAAKADTPSARAEAGLGQRVRDRRLP